MTLWFALVALSLCALVLLVVPLLRPLTPEAAAGAALAPYRDQLAELNRTLAAGEIDKESADADRAAIERRILAEPAASTALQTTPNADRWTAAAVAAAVLAGATALYATLGQPYVPDSLHVADTQPTTISSAGATAANAASPAAAKSQLPDVDTMIQRLADRLKAQPDNADGWRMLGWSYAATGHYHEAADAFARAVKLQPGNASYRSAYGEALVMVNGGTVNSAARDAFTAAEAQDPADARAHYYLGLAKSQAGDMAGARAEWKQAVALANGPKVPAALRDMIAAKAGAAGLDVTALNAPVQPDQPATPAALPPSGNPSPAQVQAAQGMSPADRQAMIKSMVDGLDQKLRQNPKDPEGWVRLMRSRKVLGQDDLAEDALKRALAAYADDRDTRNKLIAAAGAMGIKPVQ